MSKIPFVLFVVLLSLPTLASNPGEPLDCSDWVFLEPGFSCREIAPFPCDKAVCEVGGMNFAVDNEGAILMLRWDQTASPPCGSEAAGRLELVASNDLSEVVIGYVEHRCVNPVSERIDRIIGDGIGLLTEGFFYKLLFDEENGRALLGSVPSSVENENGVTST